MYVNGTIKQQEHAYSNSQMITCIAKILSEIHRQVNEHSKNVCKYV